MVIFTSAQNTQTQIDQKQAICLILSFEDNQRPGSLVNVLVKIHDFSNMASDWLAQLPVDQEQC